MKISIDTREESAEDIRALIRFLESLIGERDSPAERLEEKPSARDETGTGQEGDFSVMQFLSDAGTSQEKEDTGEEKRNDGDDDVPPLIPY